MSQVLLSTKAVAERLSVAEETLRYWRWRGTGPRYLRVGRAIRYRPEDLEAWLVKQEQLPGSPVSA